MSRLIVLLLPMLALTQCSPPPPPVGQARADAATLAACREHADAVYDRNHRDTIYTISSRDTPYSANYTPGVMVTAACRSASATRTWCATACATPAPRPTASGTTEPRRRPESRSRPDGQPVSDRRRLRAAQCADLLRRQRHLLDRLVDAARGHRLAGLGTDPLRALGQRHRVLQPGTLGGDLAARRRGGRPDRPGAADGGLAVRRRRPGGDPGRADPDRVDPGRVHRRPLGVQRHGRDLRPAGAPVPDPRPGAARLPARRGGAELADLQRRPLHRPGAVGPDDRRLGRGAADRLQRRRLPVRQPDHVPAAARSRDPARPSLHPQRAARRDRGHPLRRAPPRHRAAHAVRRRGRHDAARGAGDAAALRRRSVRPRRARPRHACQHDGLRRPGRRHPGGDPRPSRRSDPHRRVRRPGD